MNNLYIAILELTTDVGIRELVNEKIDPSKDKYKYSGFEFKILQEHDDYIHLSVYAYNPYIAMLLGASVDKCGTRYGIKYDDPFLFRTNGGFAGVLCTYIFQISRTRIEKSKMLQQIGIDSDWKLSPYTYHQLLQTFYSSERVTGFNEMLNYIRSNAITYNETLEMLQHTVVYDENFISSKGTQKNGLVSFQENLTLIAAEPFVRERKHVAILNFANPIEIGGGVLRGATAQEEYLCRLSNLYYSLTSENAKTYYEKNRDIKNHNQFNSMFLGTDSIIYSPDVMVLKQSNGYKPGFPYEFDIETYRDYHYSLDVLTCAAPFFSGSGYILPNGDLMHLLERRIKNIFEVCIENNVDVLILGAFGCGAFHNPPDIVADAFRNVLLEKRYASAFEQVVFAIKRTEIVCKNIEAFERNFSLFPNINENGNEKKHRLSWKWVCNCGIENYWDNLMCENCGKHRKYHQKVICY